MQMKSMPNNETDVTVRFYAAKHQDELIRSTIRRWGRQQYGRIDKNYTLTEKDILVKSEPYLYLENVANDKTGPISEGDGFVLSCTARGSKLMAFRWFKDDMLVNLTRATHNKWENLISKGRNTDHYTALLAVQDVRPFDGGKFTCHVEDYGLQQCRSLHVDVIHRPQIRLEPASLTVDKGEPFTIKCLSLAMRGEKYKFAWTKDRNLLPVKTDYEHYEILYPGGSILQVTRLNKTTTYSCLAHLGKLSTESALLVHVVDKHVLRPCPAGHYEGFAWPATAPGGDSRQDCPDEYYGMTTRACIMLESGEPRWLLPDYSNCTQLHLMQHLRDFRYLEEGYARTTPLATLLSIKQYVEAATLLRGEGRVVLQFIERVVNFNNASGYADHVGATDLIVDILDGVLAQNVSLNKEQQVVTLQKLVHRQLMVLSSSTSKSYERNLRNLQVAIEIDDESYVNPARVIRATYRNLYEFLTKKSVIRLNFSDDREMQYELFSGVTSVWRWERVLKNDAPRELQLRARINHLFSVPMFHADYEMKERVKCVLAEYAASDYAWDASKCRLMFANASSASCECDDEGTMTILLVDDVRGEQTHVHLGTYDELVVVGCTISCVLCGCAGLLMAITWCRHKSAMTFLKAQCALSISCCMLLFLLGFSDAITQRFYLHALSCLLIFYLIALASQLSTLLIIYSELIEMQNIATIKPTIVGITSGAPVIAVFTNHLTHNIKDIPMKHWWIVKDTLSFYIFLVCIAIVSLLYAVLFCFIAKLLKKPSDKAPGNRSRMMTRTTLIFVGVICSAAMSVTCVNFPAEKLWRYAFSTTSILLGLTILICLASQTTSLCAHIKEEKQVNFNLALHENNPQIEEYNASPTQYNTTSICQSNSLNSPDILGTKVFAELDLVASSRALQGVSDACNDNAIDKREADSEKTISAHKCVTFCDQVEYNTSSIEDNELLTPEGSAHQTLNAGKSIKSDESEETQDTNLDEVMDGISNDLKYLLNGHPINTISC